VSICVILYVSFSQMLHLSFEYFSVINGLNYWFILCYYFQDEFPE
jgi:hypothetical protein